MFQFENEDLPSVSEYEEIRRRNLEDNKVVVSSHLVALSSFFLFFFFIIFFLSFAFFSPHCFSYIEIPLFATTLKIKQKWF